MRLCFDAVCFSRPNPRIAEGARVVSGLQKLEDCVREMEKLIDTWTKLVAQARQASQAMFGCRQCLVDCCRRAWKMLHAVCEAIMSGSSDLVSACLWAPWNGRSGHYRHSAEVCVDRPAVFAQLKDEEGNGAVHIASREGYAHIIKAERALKPTAAVQQVLVENGADVHEINGHGSRSCMLM